MTPELIAIVTVGIALAGVIPRRAAETPGGMVHLRSPNFFRKGWT